MKRYLLLVVFLSCLPFVNIFLSPFHPHTQDGLVHLARMAAYFKALRDGEFPVRWVGYLNYGYGMPLFDFIYQFPYIISSLLLSLGIGLVFSYKMVLFLSFLFAGFFAYLFSEELFQDKKKAFLFSIFYQFAQFRLVELFVRGDIGEVYTYTFLPLVCFGLIKISKKISYSSILLTSFATALLIVSHNSLSLSFFAVAALFIFFLPFSKKTLIVSFGSLALGLLLSLFYWFPALSDHKYTFGDLFMKDLYLQHFAPFQNFFIPNFFNNPNLRIGGVPIQIGIFPTIVLITALIALGMKRSTNQEKRIFIFSFIIFGISFFFMQPMSKILWEHSALLRQFQFPWRFLGVVVFATSLLSVSIVDLFGKKTLYFLVVFLAVVSTYWYWFPSYGWDKVNEEYYWNYPLTSTYYGETDVIWTPGQAKSYPKSPVEFAAGSGKISHFSKNSYMQTFTVTANTSGTLVDHTDYFPGWRVYVNGKQAPIEFQDINYRGQITFPIPKGTNNVKVIFQETVQRLIVDILSLIVFAALLILFLVRRVRKYEEK